MAVERVSVLVSMMPRKKVDPYGEKDGKGFVLSAMCSWIGMDD